MFLKNPRLIGVGTGRRLSIAFWLFVFFSFILTCEKDSILMNFVSHLLVPFPKWWVFRLLLASGPKSASLWPRIGDVIASGYAPPLAVNGPENALDRNTTTVLLGFEGHVTEKYNIRKQHQKTQTEAHTLQTRKKLKKKHFRKKKKKHQQQQNGLFSEI